MTASTFGWDWVVLHTRVLADVISIFSGFKRKVQNNMHFVMYLQQRCEQERGRRGLL